MSDTFNITLTEGGAIKGKNATIKSIEPIEGGNRITFEWEENDGRVLTDSMDVMNGEKGDTGLTPNISMNATVNQTIGTPHVSVNKTGTKENPHFDVAFSGIKGEKGDIGITPDIDMTATVNQSIGTPSIEVSKSGTAENPSFNLEIKNVKGEKGDTGATPNLTATASVGNTVGTPSVSVSRSGSNENPKLNFNFNNLKGNTGATPNISASATVNQTVGNPTVSVERSGTNENPNLAFSFSGIKGEKGDDGLDGFSARLPQAEYNPSDYLVVDDGTDAKKISVKDFVDNSNKDIWKAHDEFSGKNLMKLPYAGGAVGGYNGILFTKQDDGSYIANGTGGYSHRAIYADFSELNLKVGTYILSAYTENNNNISSGSVGVLFRFNVSGTVTDFSAQLTPTTNYAEVRFEITQEILDGLKDGTVTFEMRVNAAASTSVDNVRIYPMIRYASDTDTTWQPYVKTNRELEEAEKELLEEMTNSFDDVWKTQADTGVKNLLVHPYVEGNGVVRSGVTWTIDADGTVHANGTASGYSYFDLENNSIILKAGNYILSMSDGDEATNVMMICRNLNKTYGYANNPLYPLKFTVTEEEAEAYRNGTDKITIRVYVNQGLTVENAIIHPMLREAIWEDASWVPYAKTNQELTENVTALDNTLKTKSNLKVPHLSQDANIPYDNMTFNVAEYDSQSPNLPSARIHEVMTFQSVNNSVQLALGRTEGTVYIRQNQNGTWQAWKRLVTEDELTALAARVTALENK